MALELVGITRRFGSAVALDDVSLVVERGDCHAFLGHNGAGKTTAMRIALGLDPHFEGRVLVDGFDAARHPREARARLAGLIEVPGFHGGLDGETNLAWLARLSGMGGREARIEARRLLALVGLAHAGTKPVQAYSHGMKQRLGIAQALIGKPAVVLLDEPTNGLDPEGIAEVRALLARLTAGEGLTVLVSSHQLAQLAGLCNKISVLKHGRLLVSGSAEELLADASARHLIEARDPQVLARVAAQLGLGAREARRVAGDLPRREGLAPGSLYELGTRDPVRVLRDLVAAGVELSGFAPHPVTLEELYLRHSASGEAAQSPAHSRPESVRAAASQAAPAQRRAPPAPLARVARYEAARVWSKGTLLFVACLPALLALIDLLRNHARASGAAELVAQGQLATATDVNAFQAMSQAMQSGLPLCAAVVVGVSSQTLASELGRGTLRNLLLRPVLRWQVVLGKAASLAVASLLAYLLLLAVTGIGAAALFEFRGVTEILPDGQPMELLPAGELWAEFGGLLWTPIAPLIAWSAVGMCASALVRSGALALALGLGAFVFTDLARTVARGTGAEGWLLSAHLPSPLGDTSFVNYFSEIAQGISNATVPHAAMQWSAPLAWLVLAFAIAALALSRRSVP